MSQQTLKIDFEIDINQLKGSIDDSDDLNDNEKLFSKLVEFQRVKEQIKNVLEQVEQIERDAKGTIKQKANQLYGDSWTAIKGDGYKITKSETGAVFNIIGRPQKKFIEIKESVNTKEVLSHIKEKGKLPGGLEYNPSRGTSIRITVHDNDQAES